MGFNEFLSSIFGNKATRDMKEIKPWVDKVKAAYPEIAALDNDAPVSYTHLDVYKRQSKVSPYRQTLVIHIAETNTQTHRTTESGNRISVIHSSSRFIISHSILYICCLLYTS